MRRVYTYKGTIRGLAQQFAAPSAGSQTMTKIGEAAAVLSIFALVYAMACL